MAGGKRILLVDDDIEFVEANRTMLESHGYEIVTAFNGTEAIERARACFPHLVILDVMMASDTEGISVSRRFREDQDLCHLPVILLTGIRRTMDLPERLRPDERWLPVSRVLEKPVPPGRLLAEIAKVLSEPPGRRGDLP